MLLNEANELQLCSKQLFFLPRGDACFGEDGHGFFVPKLNVKLRSTWLQHSNNTVLDIFIQFFFSKNESLVRLGPVHWRYPMRRLENQLISSLILDKENK